MDEVDRGGTRMRPMRIAMIGQRGLPATWGGVERHVEEIGARLVERGHHVTVFCRRNYADDAVPSYRGMELLHTPTVSTKHFDAITHSAVATLSAMRGGYDIIHYHAIGPGLVAGVPRYLSRAKVVQTVHGLDAERAKWGAVATRVLRTASWMSSHVPDATIGVAHHLVDHYASHWNRTIDYIPNGVDPRDRSAPKEIEQRWGLGDGNYVLFVGRLVPEKAPDRLVRAFRALPGDTRLVIAGGSSFSDGFRAELVALADADERIILTRNVYGDVLAELYSNARAFVLPSDLEGLPLTLLEAASFGTPVVVSDIAPHVEVVGDSGPGHRIFPAGDEAALARTIWEALADPVAERHGAGKLREKVLREYRWDDVVDATERVYDRVLAGRGRRRS